MKIKKRGAVLFFSVLYVISIFFVNVSADTPLRGVALGDSVAAFYGVDENDGYVAVLSVIFLEQNIENDFLNLAVSGLNTQTLLEQLTDSDVLTAINNADMITLNIGGNNILNPLMQILINEFQLMLENVEIFTPDMLFEFINKQLTEQQTELLMDGVTLFENDFPVIINILKTEAPNAEIFVNTVYNPITPMFGVYDSSEIIIPGINNFINNNADALGYTVVDIYTAFNDANETVTNFDLLSGSFDIHPNAAGYTLIAETVAERMLEYIGVETEIEIEDEIESVIEVDDEIEVEIEEELEPEFEAETEDKTPPFIIIFIFIAAAVLIAVVLYQRSS